MVYVRHRDRMVQESVYEDLRNALLACHWLAGTTTRDVKYPDGTAMPAGTTVTEAQVLKLVGTKPNPAGTATVPAQVVVIDYFPEVEEDDGTTGHTEPNTLAIDEGVADTPEPVELGSNLMEQVYTFSLAFYANSDAVAKAVLNDLRDRYFGRIVKGDWIDLYDYNSATPDVPVGPMEILDFTYARNTDLVSPHEVHLFFAQLEIVDYVD